MNFHKHWHINRYVACDLKKFAVLSDGHFGVKWKSHVTICSC